MIRPAQERDLPEILEIINFNILHSTAVYDYKTKSLSEIEQWHRQKNQEGWPVLVAEYNNNIAGYATFGTFRLKEGFKYTVEHSVYVPEEYNGLGIGRLLLSELIKLAKEGYHTMIGCIDANNTNSIAFHKRFGFTEQGILKQSGYKFGRWLDLMFMQLLLK